MWTCDDCSSTIFLEMPLRQKCLLMDNSEHPAKSYENLKSSIFLSLCVYLCQNCVSQFLSHCESAELVFCSEELRSFPCKNQHKSLTLSDLVRKFKFAVQLRDPKNDFIFNFNFDDKMKNL